MREQRLEHEVLHRLTAELSLVDAPEELCRRLQAVSADEVAQTGRVVRVEHPSGVTNIVSLAEVQVLETGTGKELQKNGKANQSTADQEGDAQRAADGELRFH